MILQPRSIQDSSYTLRFSDSKQDGADFIPVKCFGAAAENHAKYLTKCRLISLTGRINDSQWADEETGGARERYEITGSFIGYLDNPRPSESKEVPPDTKPSKAPNRATPRNDSSQLKSKR